MASGDDDAASEKARRIMKQPTFRLHALFAASAKVAVALGSICNFAFRVRAENRRICFVLTAVW